MRVAIWKEGITVVVVEVVGGGGGGGSSRLNAQGW